MFYKVLCYGGFMVSGILFVTAVGLFWKLRIPSVTGDLTGLSRKKQIRRIQQENSESRQKNFYSQTVGMPVKTEVFTAVLPQEEETTVLNESDRRKI